MSKRQIAKRLEAVREDATPRLLAFDPTPPGLVGARSLRKAFKNEWARIRTRHLKEHGPSCALCRVAEPAQRLIDGHEVYSFPNPEAVRLECILFVCKKCHDAIHLERTRGRCGPAYVHVIEEHYCKVNGGISEEELQIDYAKMVQRQCVILEFYGGGGATPNMDFGAYQSGVDAALKRKRARAPADDDDDFEMFPDHECPWLVGRQ